LDYVLGVACRYREFAPIYRLLSEFVKS